MNGNGRRTLEARGQDHRDAEIARLKREVEALRERERLSRAEAVEARAQFSHLTAMTKRFASSMNARVRERQQYRRRLAAQYGVSRMLAEARDLDEAAPKVFEILGERLGWQLGVLWIYHQQAGVLRRRGIWRSSGSSPGAMEEACEDMTLRRGESLPGRVWEREEPVWVEDVLADGDFLRNEAAAEDGIRGAFAFPIKDGGFVGVFEFFRREVLPPDEDLLRTGGIIGDQIGQFLERSRAEEERDHALVKEREARERAIGILESINDAFVAFDHYWRYTYANGAARELVSASGRDPENLLGKVLWEEFPELVGTGFQTGLLRAVREGETVEFEEFHPPLDIWLHVRAYPSEDGISVYLEDATERKEAQEALRRNEARWRALIGKGADIITISDRGGTIRFVSPSIESVCGYTVEEFVGLNPFEAGHIHPDDVEHCEEAFRELADNPGHSVTIQHRYLHKSGEWRWLEGTFTSLFHDPAVGGLVTNFRDVTGRKEAEERLRESEERFRAAFEQARVGIVQASLDGRVLVPNPGFCQIIGYTEEEARGLHVRDFTHPDDYEADMTQGRRVLEGEIPGYSMEKRYVRKDGSVVWVNLTSTVARGDDGEPLYALAIVEDIDERKYAEEALRESEVRFRRAFSNNMEAMAVWSPSGEITDANDAMLDLIGYTREELEAGSLGWMKLTPPEYRDRDAQAVAEVEARGVCTPYEKEFVRKDGRRVPILIGGGRFDERAGTGILFAVDLTERKQAEEERERSRAREWTVRAQTEERRRISRELHDRVAHAMGVVHQSLELYEALKERKPSQAEAKMELARETTREALHLTRNISRELLDTEAKDGLSAALSNLLKTTVPPGMESNINVEGDETLIPPRVREQLFLILREAVRNAVSHSDADRLGIEVMVGPERVLSCVEDDGRGLEEAPDGHDGASGRGLQSMRERVELIGGALRLSSTPGAGTRVEASAPLEANVLGEAEYDGGRG